MLLALLKVWIMKEMKRKQCMESGMAFVLLLFIVWLFTHSLYFLYAGMAILVLTMSVPMALKLPARIWYALSHKLSMVGSFILLGLIFILVVAPVSICRRLAGKDSLLLKQWKRGDKSVFIIRDHTYSPADMQMPF